MKDIVVWTVGGPQGSGVDSSANLFAKALAFAGYWVFGKREYYSNIMGEHSYFQVRAAAHPVQAHVDATQFLAGNDAETIVRHAWDVEKGGVILYDPQQAHTRIEAIPTLEQRVKEEILALLSQNGFTEDMEGVLQAARERGVQLLALPHAAIHEALKEKYPDVKAQTLKRLSNTIVVAASLQLLEIPPEFLKRSIEDIFRGREKIITLNWAIAELVAEMVDLQSVRSPIRLKPRQETTPRLYLNGNQAVALGKLFGGCTFQSYYPITPASDESEFLEANEEFPLVDLPAEGWKGEPRPNGKRGNIVVLQTEDEIAAITAATGAALAGARAATATSGPGFSLMAEGLGWAGINEVPVVVTLYQRAGPSTGLPTRHEQGDLMFTIHAGHGEFPRIVYASGDIEEAFYDTVRVFNYAERFQCPVIHILDKAIANSTATVPYFDFSRVKVERGALEEHPQEDDYERFRFTENGISPRVRLGTEGAVFWNTGDEHDPRGHISEDPVNRTRMMDKRMRRLDLILAELPAEEKMLIHGDPEGTLVLVSWGSPKGAILEAMELLRDQGHRVKFVQAKLLWPFPRDEMAEALESAQKLVAIEMNYSAQFARLVTEFTQRTFDHYIVKYNGRPMSATEILEALQEIVDGKAQRRIVLTHGR